VPAPVEPGQQEAAARTEQAPAPAKKDGQGELHAAKCGCGSAADCTCKKGSCECPRCKKRQDVVPSLEAEGRAAREPRAVRLDASAGVLI
jgi:hypothetical protein